MRRVAEDEIMDIWGNNVSVDVGCNSNRERREKLHFQNKVKGEGTKGVFDKVHDTIQGKEVISSVGFGMRNLVKFMNSLEWSSNQQVSSFSGQEMSIVECTMANGVKNIRSKKVNFKFIKELG